MPSIRIAVPSDLPSLGRMGASMVRFHHDFDAKRFILPDELEQGYAWWLGRELDNPNAVLLVAEDDASHELLGYTYGTLEETNWSSLLGPHGAFQDLWVDSHARRNGIGKRLVEETLLRFRERGARQVVLMTAVQNQVAQRLAHALGFRQTMIEMTNEL